MCLGGCGSSRLGQIGQPASSQWHQQVRDGLQRAGEIVGSQEDLWERFVGRVDMQRMVLEILHEWLWVLVVERNQKEMKRPEMRSWRSEVLGRSGPEEGPGRVGSMVIIIHSRLLGQAP